MPTYDVKHKETGEEKTILVSISKMEEMKEEGWQVVHKSTPEVISQKDGTLSKTSSDWRNHLSRIKKHSGRGNTINTY